MPKFTDSEIFSKIESHEISAITLDTSVIEKLGFRFSSKPLYSLRQFHNTHIEIVFSEIVAREVNSHLTIELEKVQTELDRAIEQFSRKFDGQDKIIGKLKSATSSIDDPRDYAANLWETFLSEVSAKTIRVNDPDVLKDVVNLYFDSLPPFAKEAKKKNEFPDALALVSLQHWAAGMDGFLLAVSADADWARFGAEAHNIIVVDDLNRCLDLFNKSSHSVARGFFNRLEAGSGDSLFDGVFECIEEKLQNEGFYIEADSQYTYEEEPLEVKLIDVNFFDSPYVVEANEDTISFSISAELVASFEASFSFSVTDSVDRDEIPLGEGLAKTEDTVDSTIIVTVSRDEPFESSSMKVEVNFSRITVDFGTVEPDWGDHYYEE